MYGMRGSLRRKGNTSVDRVVVESLLCQLGGKVIHRTHSEKRITRLRAPQAYKSSREQFGQGRWSSKVM